MLMNYVPKNFKPDSIYQPESPLLKEELNTIVSLQIYNGYREDFKLSETDKKWLENRIDHIATALFLDGKKILINPVGGYSGCSNKMIDTLKLNNNKIILLKFCHTCTDAYRDRNFIQIFNNRMYSLMQIEPPNRKTQSFYGEFRGSNKDKMEMKLVMKRDRTFKFWLHKEGNSDFTEGLWENKNDTLILNSKTLSKNDSLASASSTTKWIVFNKLEFLLKKEKLTAVNGKQKLKKFNQ